MLCGWSALVETRPVQTGITNPGAPYVRTIYITLYVRRIYITDPEPCAAYI